MHNLDARDPLPALGAKVEKPQPPTPQQRKEIENIVFETGDKGLYRGITESNSQQKKPWPFPTMQMKEIEPGVWLVTAESIV